jgi:hypothetical protein
MTIVMTIVTTIVGAGPGWFDIDCRRGQRGEGSTGSTKDCLHLACILPAVPFVICEENQPTVTTTWATVPQRYGEGYSSTEMHLNSSITQQKGIRIRMN